MRQSKPAVHSPVTGRPANKLPVTFLDAAAVGVSTTLIIGMVGSLVFFLIIAFYRGQYDARLMYIFGLYSAATVLVARIAIESGRAYANAFSIPLAIVSILAIMRFVSIGGLLGPVSWLINIGLLALAWFLADRITFDCTLISERERSLQQGLLQSLGLVQKDSIIQVARRSEPQRKSTERELASTKPTKKQRKHNPGVWVLYFALLAFPLFGLGQLAIPDEQRGLAFGFLLSYLACALCLLVVTALVGMRRYLRQRGVEMPSEMSLQWLTLGVGSTLLILLLCWLMPLPGRSLGLIGLPPGFESPDSLTASRWGWGNEQSSDMSNAQAARSQPADLQDTPPPEDAPADGPPQQDGQGPPQADDQASGQRTVPGKNSQEQQQSDTKRRSSDTSEQSAKPAGDKAEEPAGEPAGDKHKPNAANPEGDEPQGDKPEARENAAAESDGNDSQPAEAESSDDSSSTQASATPPATNPIAPLLNQFSSLGEFLKWLTIAALAIIVLLYVITHPSEIANMWQQLRMWWGALWGRRKQTAGAQAESAPLPSQTSWPRRPFSSFVNPFAAQVPGWTPAQVIEHSFAALESWGAEQGKPRGEQQTAAEFARQISARHPTLGPHALHAANMLDQLMFAAWTPQAEDVKPLAQLWQRLEK